VDKKLLILGCGRSGTRYFSDLLRSNDIDVQHEKIGNDGVACWYSVFNSNKPPVSFFLPNYKETEFIKIHQVRNPIDVIASAHTLMPHSWEYVRRSIPINENDNLLLTCMKYWYYWNVEAEKNSIFTYKIEDIRTKISDILPLIGKNPQDFKFNSVGSNSRKHQDLTWEDLYSENSELADLIKSLAAKYGY